MKVSSYLKPEHCLLDLKSANKEDAIKEIAIHFADKGIVKDKAAFTAEILKREKIGSTGIGCGVAIPHARTNAVGEFVLGFGRSEKGIEFDSIDGTKVHLIFVIGTNLKELNLYLRFLAELSRLIMNENFRNALLRAQRPEEIVSIINKYEKIKPLN